MTVEIAIVLLIIGGALLLFVTEWFAIDTVSILVMVAFMATGILTVEEGFKGFTNPATITVAAMFVLSAAIFKTGALQRIGALLMQTGRKGYLVLSFALMTVVGFLSGFINNTAAVALLIPVILDIARRGKFNASRLLMPLSFGAILGGTCTLIGTSTNILVSGIAEERGLAGFGMFELTSAGLVFFVIGVGYMLLTARWLLPDHEMEDSYQDRYQIGSYLTEVEVLPGSSLVGQLLQESALVKDYRIEVVKIIRNEDPPPPESLADVRLRERDVLRLRCQVGQLSELIKAEDLLIMMESEEKFSQAMTGFRLFEALVTPSSGFLDRTLEEIHFQDRYNGANVLGIRHRQEVISERIEQVKLRSGDILLIRAEPRLMRRFHDNDDLVVLSQTQEDEEDHPPILPAVLILAGVIGAAALNVAPIVLTASVGVLLLVLLRMIQPEEVYAAIDWKVIFMLGGVLTMSAALEKTGGDQLLATVVTRELGQFGPQWVLSIFFIITMVTSNIMSNNAAGALMAPIAITVATNLGVSERPFLMAVTYAASLSFILPMGYQTNTMIYTPGDYRVLDYIRIGAPLSLLLCMVAHFLLPFLFPF